MLVKISDIVWDTEDTSVEASPEDLPDSVILGIEDSDLLIADLNDYCKEFLTDNYSFYVETYKLSSFFGELNDIEPFMGVLQFEGANPL